MNWREQWRTSWRGHRYSFLISLGVTLLGGGLYVHTYVAKSDTPLAGLVESLEAKTYDARFRARGRTPPNPNIVVVAIDQGTLERLGSWPFSRVEYVRLLEQLKAQGARVVGFDINFPKPDAKSGLTAVQQARAEYVARTQPAQRDRAFLARLEQMEREADTDARFAQALAGSGNTVLGYFFFPSREEVRYVDAASQEAADQLLAFSSYTTKGVQDSSGRKPPPLAEVFNGEEGYLAETNLPAFVEAADFSVGYFNIQADADSVFRRTPLVYAYRGAWRGGAATELNFYPSLDVQILRRYLNIPEHQTVLLHNHAGVEAVEVGSLRIPTDPEGRMLVHYQGGPFTYPYVSFADAAAGTAPPGFFKDKIVLVGPTALAIGDFGPTPFAESFHPGIEIHANVLDTMLSGRFLQRGDRELLIDLALILAFGLGLGTLLATARPLWATLAALVLLAAFFAAAHLALAWYQVWLNVVLPGAVLAANFTGVTAFRVLVEEREKRKVRAAFQQYLPPAVIRALLRNPEQLTLGGVERELTILFSDIRGFTALSEQITPLELSRYLNAYAEEMTAIIFRHWGTLDKFQGDAIMCFWGAPYEQDDHGLRACAAALEMARRVDQLSLEWRAEGKPDLNIGLGISTGRVVVGNMGSRTRFNYTVLGDPVNLASRLEGANKQYSTRVLLSDFTHAQATGGLSILEQRLARHFRLTAEWPGSSNSEPALGRARAVALYLGLTQHLAAPALLLDRYGDRYGKPGAAAEEAGPALARVRAQVEPWMARDSRLRLLVEEARRSLRGFLFRQLDWIRVKGKSQPVAIYEMLGTADEANTFSSLIASFDAGLRAYRDQRWDEALLLFEQIIARHPGDGPARVFAERCRRFRAQPPPPQWDGVFEMKSK